MGDFSAHFAEQKLGDGSWIQYSMEGFDGYLWALYLSGLPIMRESQCIIDGLIEPTKISFIQSMIIDLNVLNCVQLHKKPFPLFFLENSQVYYYNVDDWLT